MKFQYLLAFMGLLVVMPVGNAAVQLSQQFYCPLGEVVSVQSPGLLGVLNSGQTVLCITLPNHVARIGDTASLTVTSVGPTLISITAVGSAGGLVGGGAGLTGCTFAGVSLGSFPAGVTSAPGASGQDSGFAAIGGDVVNNQWGTFTMTAPSCSGLIRAFLCISNAAITTCSSATTLYDIVIAVNISTDDSKSQIMVINCGNTGSTETALTQSTTCGAQSINAALSGNINAALSGTVNSVNSGTQHLIVDSWPTLNVAGSLSIAVTSMPTLNVAETNTVTIASWPSLSASVGITSIPTLNIGSIPTITVNDQVHILDSVTFHQIIDGTAHFVLDNGTLYVNGVEIVQTIGNQTVTVPDTLHLCGEKTNDTPCKPVSLIGSVNGSANLTVPFWERFSQNTAIPLLLLIFFQVMGETVGKKRKDAVYLILASALSMVYAFSLPVGTALRVLLFLNALYLANVIRIRAQEAKNAKNPTT